MSKARRSHAKPSRVIKDERFNTEVELGDGDQTLSGKVFIKCSFEGTNMAGKFLKNIRFTQCNMKFCNLTNAELTNVRFDGNSSKGVLFMDTIMHKCAIGGIQIDEMVVSDVAQMRAVDRMSYSGKTSMIGLFDNKNGVSLPTVGMKGIGTKEGGILCLNF